jgi:protease-4
MGDICASGGYYIASAGDEIYANPSTLTGSIGVIMSYPVINKLEETLGLNMVTIKSDKFKDVGSIHREPTLEEKKLLSELVLETYDQFIKDVAIGRGMSTNEVKLLATGQLYTGSKAVKNGLVDEIGGLREAIESARIIAKLDKNEKIIKIGEESSFLNSLFKVSVSELRGLFLSKLNIKLKL